MSKISNDCKFSSIVNLGCDCKVTLCWRWQTVLGTSAHSWVMLYCLYTCPHLSSITASHFPVSSTTSLSSTASLSSSHFSTDDNEGKDKTEHSTEKLPCEILSRADGPAYVPRLGLVDDAALLVVLLLAPLHLLRHVPEDRFRQVQTGSHPFAPPLLTWWRRMCDTSSASAACTGWWWRTPPAPLSPPAPRTRSESSSV